MDIIYTKHADLPVLDTPEKCKVGKSLRIASILVKKKTWPTQIGHIREMTFLKDG